MAGTMIAIKDNGDAKSVKVNENGDLKVYTEGAFGEVGSIAITGTSKVEAPSGFYIYHILIIADVVVGSQGDVVDAVNSDLSDYTALSAGTPLYGRWTDITLASGEAIGYLKAV